MPSAAISPDWWAPLFGLLLGSAVYLLGLLLGRLLPAPFRLLHLTWILLSLGAGAMGWWWTPREGRYEEAVVTGWNRRQAELAPRPEWQALGRVWRRLGELSEELPPLQPEAQDASEALAAWEEELGPALAGLAGLIRAGLISEPERLAVEGELRARAAYLREESGLTRRSASAAPRARSDLEARYRLLSRIVPGPDSAVLLWQQRVRLAAELGRLDRPGASAGGLGGPGAEFREVPELTRQLALLLVDLSCVPSEEQAPEAPGPGPGR